MGAVIVRSQNSTKSSVTKLKIRKRELFLSALPEYQVNKAHD